METMTVLRMIDRVLMAATGCTHNTYSEIAKIQSHLEKLIQGKNMYTFTMDRQHSIHVVFIKVSCGNSYIQIFIDDRDDSNSTYGISDLKGVTRCSGKILYDTDASRNEMYGMAITHGALPGP